MAGSPINVNTAKTNYLYNHRVENIHQNDCQCEIDRTKIKKKGSTRHYRALIVDFPHS